MNFMKSLKRAALLMLAVVFTNASIVLANDAEGSDATVSVRQIKSEQKKAVIRITSLSAKQPVVLRIKDKKGSVLHKKAIKQSEDYTKKYDFSDLPGGEYIVELSTRDGVISKSFVLTDGHTNPKYFKPVVQVAPGMIKVAFVNRISSPVSLKLYDQAGRMIYEERVLSQAIFSKGFNVSRIKAGLYSLTILGDHYVYSKSIRVK